jgi:small ligand-binding sensory domain FIST
MWLFPPPSVLFSGEPTTARWRHFQNQLHSQLKIATAMLAAVVYVCAALVPGHGAAPSLPGARSAAAAWPLRAPPPCMAMKWSVGISEPQDDWRSALAGAVEKLGWSDAEAPPELAFVFVPQQFAAKLQDVVSTAARELSPKLLVGVVGAGVLGGGVEFDQGEGGISAIAGSLPDGTNLRPFIMSGESLPVWSQLFSAETDASAGRPGFFLFGDPYAPASQAMACLNTAWPSSVVTGGLSCPTSEQCPTLGLYQAGAGARILPVGSVLGVGMRGPFLELHSAVAQGAIGVGKSFAVTAGAGNTVAELDGVPALARLQEVVDTIKGDQRTARLIQKGLMVGLQPPEIDGEEGQNGGGWVGGEGGEDYLIRQVLGATGKGGLVVGDRVVPGQTRLRFHVRDEAAASDDLRLLLSRYNLNRQFAGRFGAGSGGAAPLPAAALLFACNGRGSNMFSKNIPAHDSAMFSQQVGGGAVPLAGLFCNGEIGPVGVAGIAGGQPTARLHGFTAVIAMLWDTSAAGEAATEGSGDAKGDVSGGAP